MRAIYDLVDLAPVNIAARQIPYADQTLENLFPSREVEQIDYRLIQEKNLEQIVPARALDTPAPLIARPGLLELRGGLPAFSAMDLLTETDLQRARRLAGIQVDLQPTVEALAAGTTRTILNSIEVMRGMILSTGKVTLNANGVNQVADYNVPSANKVTAGTAWTTVSAPAVTDLDTWRTVYVAANGGPPARILTSTRAQRLLLRNTSVINAVAGAQTGRTQATPAEISGFLAAEGLPNIETYDRQYGSFDAGFTRVLPENILVMLPSGALGETLLGITEEAVELVQAGILAAQSAPGITVVTMVEDNPVQKAVLSAAIPLPVLSQPYQLLIATLW
jgi:hypothetical protein